MGLAAWAGCGLVLGGLLLARHLVALPTPPVTDTRLRDAVAGFHPDRAATWRAVHVMYRRCPCSQRTITHLRAAPRPADLDEVVVMVDDDGAAGPEDAMLRDAGFDVEVITPAALHAQLDLEAAPVLVVARPDHELVYVGGYNRHKQSTAYEDLAILADLRAEAPRAALPVFGCPTSARLADAVDPLGLGRW